MKNIDNDKEAHKLKMSRMRDLLENSHWAALYQHGLTNGDMDQKYGHWTYDDGGWNPIFIDANEEEAVQMNRHCDNTCAYNVGITDPALRTPYYRKMLKGCSNTTGAPYLCADAILPSARYFTPTQYQGDGFPLQYPLEAGSKDYQRIRYYS